jgi:hypothetical protein
VAEGQRRSVSPWRKREPKGRQRASPAAAAIIAGKTVEARPKRALKAIMVARGSTAVSAFGTFRRLAPTGADIQDRDGGAK